MKAKRIFGMSVLMLSSVTGFAEEAKVSALDADKLGEKEMVKVAEKVKILHKLKVKRLEIDIQKTPQYSFSGPSSKKLNRDQKWLEIEALIEVDTKSKSEFLPKLDATFTIVYKGKKSYEKIERTISFKNVNVEDGEAYVVAYIDPDTLGIITDKKRPAIRDLTGIAVSVTTDNISPRTPKNLHTSELFDRKLKLDENQKWWDHSAITASKQKLMAHTETPFELARPERYPLVVKNEK